MGQESDSRSMRERMLAGDLYIANDPDLIAASQRAAELTYRYNSALDPTERWELLNLLLAV